MAKRNTPRLTMTMHEIYQEMRSVGIPCSPASIASGIESGAYPFGRIVSTGETGRRHIEVFRVDFIAWLRTRIPNEPAYDALRQALPDIPMPETKRAAMPASTAAIPFARDNRTHLYYNDSVPMSREGMKFG